MTDPPGAASLPPEAAALLDRVPSEGASPPAWVFAEVGPPLFEAIRREGFRSLILQVPAGLVRNAHDLAARQREATGARVVVAARPCFGAGDFPSRDEAAGADAEVLLGHAPIPNVPRPLPAFFVEMRSAGGDPEALAETVVRAGLPSRLGLVASIQHLDLVGPLTQALARRGRTLETGTGDRRLAYPAQALGCNYTSASAIAERVDAFVFLGTGRFHPIGLAFVVDRPVYSLDPLQNTLDPPLDRGALVRRRQLLVARCRDARRWGVIVSTFAGQDRRPMASALVARARARGLEAEVFATTRLDPGDLEGRDVDAFVNTSCPRIALDDAELYARPMLTPPEFLMAIGELPLEPYRFDTFH